MPTPQLPGFGDAAAFIRRFKDIDHRINLLFEKLNNVLANTGLSVPSPGVTQVDGSLNVVGNLNVSGSSTVSGSNGIQSSNYVAGTSGWKFNGTSLEANTGVIGNGALANPVSPVSAHADGTNFSLATGANVDKLTITVSVPSGYSQALIFAGATMNARNTTASLDYAYLAVRINAVVSGWAPLSTTTAGTYCMVSAMGSRLLTGLGSSFTITAAASTSNAAWAADSTNVINLDAIVTFLR